MAIEPDGEPFPAIITLVSNNGDLIYARMDAFDDMVDIENTINDLRVKYPEGVRVVVDIALNPEQK